MNQIIDDLELKIETTWLEETGSEFHRVIIVEYFCSDCIQSSSGAMTRTIGQQLRDRIMRKLTDDLGLMHNVDYIFGLYDNPVMKNGVWITKPSHDDMRFILRLRDEEHYTMFKMHYHG